MIFLFRIRQIYLEFPRRRTRLFLKINNMMIKFIIMYLFLHYISIITFTFLHRSNKFLIFTLTTCRRVLCVLDRRSIWMVDYPYSGRPHLFSSNQGFFCSIDYRSSLRYTHPFTTSMYRFF